MVFQVQTASRLPAAAAIRLCGADDSRAYPHQWLRLDLPSLRWGKISGRPRNLQKVEKNLILEYLMGSEPFLGGPDKADNISNKAPRAYCAMAAVGGALQVPEYINTAVKGYAGILENSFLPDGFSRQSPSYTNMYLGNLAKTAGILNNTQIAGVVENKQLNTANERLNLAFRAILDQLWPDGSYFPLADTLTAHKTSTVISQNAAKTNPLLFQEEPKASGIDILVNLGVPDPRKNIPTASKSGLPEIFFPSWMTGILRHQAHNKKSALAITLSSYGGIATGTTWRCFTRAMETLSWGTMAIQAIRP